MDSSTIEMQVSGVFGQYVYAKIPANELRYFFDHRFPDLAKDIIADVAKGHSHRWVAGHDLLVDVPKTFFEHGFGKAVHQAGHILLTDFPTKAGIPIPGLSKAGLGDFLVSHGIPKGYLNISLIDNVFSILAVAEASLNLAEAISGQMQMSVANFFSTFVVGSAELVVAFIIMPSGFASGVMAIAGIENILAGVVATYNTVINRMVPVETFLGYSLFSAVLGMSLMYFLQRKCNDRDKWKKIYFAGMRSGIVAGMGMVASYFAWGCTLGFMAYSIGEKMATNEGVYVVHEQTMKRYIEEVHKMYPDIELFDDSKLERFED